MILKGVFDFSHVDQVVVNKKDVYVKQIVGNKKKVILWHKEHHPKVYQPDEIKAMIQGYLNSPFHRVCPSENTINIYHKTKAELQTEKTQTARIGKGMERVLTRIKPGIQQPFGYSALGACDPRGPIRAGDIVVVNNVKKA